MPNLREQQDTDSCACLRLRGCGGFTGAPERTLAGTEGREDAAWLLALSQSLSGDAKVFPWSPHVHFNNNNIANLII